jgi:RHS repeat-associated protein
MPGRSYSAGSGYRYGFNGKEKDSEVSGEGNRYDFGDRTYNPKLGQWWSIDPKANKFPSVSPYVSMDDNPMLKVDPDGKDWIISTVKNANGTYTTHLKLVVAVHNASSNKNINMTQFANALSQQVKASYGGSYQKTVGYDIQNASSGLDNYPARTVLIPKTATVNVVVDVQVRVINKEADRKSNEHLVQIQNRSELPGVYGRGDIEGTMVRINERRVANIMNGNDNNTLVHELGHTFGLRHIDQKRETFMENIGLSSNPQYYSPAKQKANSTNAMFSGGSTYMNDKTSTQINGEQIETGQKKYNNGQLNKH